MQAWCATCAADASGFWELEPKRLEKAQRCLAQIAGEWDAAISRLRAFVEDG